MDKECFVEIRKERLMKIEVCLMCGDFCVIKFINDMFVGEWK